MTARGSAISLIVKPATERTPESPPVNELMATLERHGLRLNRFWFERGSDPGEAARARGTRGKDAGGSGRAAPSVPLLPPSWIRGLYLACFPRNAQITLPRIFTFP